MKNAKKQALLLVFLIAIGFFSLSAALPVRADESLISSQVGFNEAGSVYGTTQPQDIRITIARIINVILGLLGIIFVVLTIVAGFQYMTAAGNEEKAKKAMGLIKNAIIGLVIILMSWMITRFTIRQLSRAANGALDYQTYSPNL